MNKSGEKVISVYWFAIMFIVAAAIVYMVAIFYGEPYDIRKMEAEILTNRISDCLNEGGYLIQENLDEESFMKNCDLNFNVEDDYNWKQEEQYYFKVEISNFETDGFIKKIEEGNFNLGILCEDKIDESIKCLERDFYSIDKENNQYKINILSVIKKIEKNV